MGFYVQVKLVSLAKKTLEEKGYVVNIPEMPETEEPKITAWISKLTEQEIN